MILQWCEFFRSTTASSIGVIGIRSTTRRRSWAARAMGCRWHFTRHRRAIWPEASRVRRMRIGKLFFGACLAWITDDSDIVQDGPIRTDCEAELNKSPKFEYSNVSRWCDGVTYIVTVPATFSRKHMTVLQRLCGLLALYLVNTQVVITHFVLTQEVIP